MSEHALVLAAGAGRRFGGGKQVADWRGAPLLQWAVCAALATRVAGVTVVLDADAAEVSAALTLLKAPRLSLVIASDWQDGLSASLKTGVRALPADVSACAVFLGDMPMVSAGLADQLLDRVAAGAAAARPTRLSGPAHPIVFGRQALADILTLTGDTGARAVLQSLGDAVATIAVEDDGAVFDVDRREDLDALTGQAGRRISTTSPWADG